VSGGVGYFYFIIKGKITLSFASPEKENLYIYIYDVITWKKKAKRFRLYYSCYYRSKSALDQFCFLHIEITHFCDPQVICR